MVQIIIDEISSEKTKWLWLLTSHVAAQKPNQSIKSFMRDGAKNLESYTKTHKSSNADEQYKF